MPRLGVLDRPHAEQIQRLVGLPGGAIKVDELGLDVHRADPVAFGFGELVDRLPDGTLLAGGHGLIHRSWPGLSIA